MFWANVVILSISVLACIIYFSFYKKLRGKVFNRLLPNPSKIVGLQYKTKSYDLELKKRGKVWYLVDSDWEADKKKVSGLIAKLRDIVVDDIISGSDYGDYNIGVNGYITIKYPNKVVDIMIGKYVPHNEDYVYVKFADSTDIYVVAVHYLKLNHKADEYIDNYIFPLYYPQVGYIEATFGSEHLSMIRTNHGWNYDGKLLIKEYDARLFVEELLDKKADGFLEEKIKLPAKPSVVITLKAKKSSVPRYFFELDKYPNQYLMPLHRKILLVDKKAIEIVYDFMQKYDSYE